MLNMDFSAISRSLITAFHYANEGAQTITEDDIDVPFATLGLDSVALLAFLVAIEDELKIEWASEVPDTVFHSIRTIADYLISSGAALHA